MHCENIISYLQMNLIMCGIFPVRYSFILLAAGCSDGSVCRWIHDYISAFIPCRL